MFGKQPALGFGSLPSGNSTGPLRAERSVATEKQEEQIAKFLMAEIDIAEGELQRLRSEGATRVSQLLTTTTALLGASLVFSRIPGVTLQDLFITVGCISIVLSLYSLITFEYVISRDELSDKAARASGRCRRYFIARFPSTKAHVTWQYDDHPTHWVTHNRSELKRTVQYVGSALGALCVWSFAMAGQIGVAAATSAAVTSFILLITGCVWFSRRRYKKAALHAREQVRFDKLE